jgi:hypothetical protein
MDTEKAGMTGNVILQEQGIALSGDPKRLGYQL